MSASKKIEFKQHTLTDETLQIVKKLYFEGWDKDKCTNNNELKVYFKLRNDIHLAEDLIFYKDRVVVPKSLRNAMLKVLHQGHFGINRTRDRAREIFYWPGMSVEIGKLIDKCPVCEKYKYANTKEPLILHEMSEYRFQKVASDIFEFKGQSYIVIIDYLTKWLEVIKIEAKQSIDVIQAFKRVFATHGVPDIVISDNMPYSSRECKNFAKQWGFEFKTSSPEYPKSNGLAERAVQTAKNILKKSDDLELSLLDYRNTIITGLNRSPAQLLFNHKIKTTLPVVESEKCSVSEKYRNDLEKKRLKYKHYYDKNAKERRDFEKGEQVVYRKDKQWQPAEVTERFNAPRSYIIKTGETQSLRRNSNHLRSSLNACIPKRDSETNVDYNVSIDNNISDMVNTRSERSGSVRESDRINSENNTNKRETKIPVKFKDYVMY